MFARLDREYEEELERKKLPSSIVPVVIATTNLGAEPNTWDEITPVSPSSMTPIELRGERLRNQHERVTPIELPSFNTAYERYRFRITRFKADGLKWPRSRHAVYWLIHNCVAHPTLALIPNHAAVEFHELTSAWLNKSAVEITAVATTRSVPRIPSRFWWIAHNFVAHALIGVLPCKPTLRLHDWSARKMQTPDWV